MKLIHCTFLTYISFNFFCSCFVGNDIEMTVEDCLLRPHILTQFDYAHPHEISRSVSEMKEWVCAKMERPNGTLVRDCMSMYTGGKCTLCTFSQFY